MDRQELVNRAAVSDPSTPRAVLEALPRWTLERIADPSLVPLREDEPELARIGRAYELPSEIGSTSVYRITFADGAVYIGFTRQLIVDRLADQLGFGRGWGTFSVMRRAEAGIAYRVECLVSGLSRNDARARRDAEIRALTKPLNGTSSARFWHDPMDPPPEQSAVAKYYRRQEKQDE